MATFRAQIKGSTRMMSICTPFVKNSIKVRQLV